MAKKKIERLSASLDRIFSARGWGGRLKEYRVFGQWEKAVGKILARHAQPLSFRGKKLSVTVDSSAWMQQLSLLKPELIEKMNRLLGEGSVQSIVLKIGEVGATPRLDCEAPPTGTLTAGEREKVESYMKAVRDPEMREILRHVIEKDLLHRKRQRDMNRDR